MGRLHDSSNLMQDVCDNTQIWEGFFAPEELGTFKHMDSESVSETNFPYYL